MDTNTQDNVNPAQNSDAVITVLAALNISLTNVLEQIAQKSTDSAVRDLANAVVRLSDRTGEKLDSYGVTYHPMTTEGIYAFHNDIRDQLAPLVVRDAITKDDTQGFYAA